MFGLYHYPEIYRDNRRISRSLERLRLAKARQVSTGLMLESIYQAYLQYY